MFGLDQELTLHAMNAVRCSSIPEDDRSRTQSDIICTEISEILLQVAGQAG